MRPQKKSNMFIIRVTILIFLFTSVHGQDYELDKKNKTNRFGIGVLLSADYNYRTLYNNDGQEITDRLIDVRNEGERWLFGYTTGIIVAIDINERMGIVAGVGYSLKGMQTSIQRARSTFPVPDDYGYDFHFEYRSSYVEFPFEFTYMITKGKIYVEGNLGLSSSILIEERQWFKKCYDDGKREIDRRTTEYDYKRLNISPTVGVDMVWNISERIEFGIGPKLRWGVTKIIDTPISATLWNIGLETSIVMKPG